MSHQVNTSTRLMLRMRALPGMVGRCKTSIKTDVSAGLFTRGVLIGARAVAWPSHEVSAIVTARCAGASDDQIRALVAKLHAQRVEAAAGLLAE
jgi:prophage regulatory protein